MLFLVYIILFAHIEKSFSQLSEAEKQAILDEHNRLRGMVDLPASNMQQMVEMAL